jgi:hypothetical protein
VLVLGRWRGLAALAALAVSFGLLLLFVLPAILDGRRYGDLALRRAGVGRHQHQVQAPETANDGRAGFALLRPRILLN